MRSCTFTVNPSTTMPPHEGLRSGVRQCGKPLPHLGRSVGGDGGSHRVLPVAGGLQVRSVLVEAQDVVPQFHVVEQMRPGVHPGLPQFAAPPVQPEDVLVVRPGQPGRDAPEVLHPLLVLLALVAADVPAGLGGGRSKTVMQADSSADFAW